MLILICGEYKEGKTISACTFPKPLLFLDWDDGAKSIYHVLDKDGKPLVGDVNQVTVVPFYKQTVCPLTFSTGDKMAPQHTQESPKLMATYNDIIGQLNKEGTYKGVKYKTLVIDSLTNFFRAWKECILSMNRLGTLRIQDYGTLEAVLFGQFIPTLKTLSMEKKLDYIILIDHTEIEKDETSGQILEYPIGPSRNMGRVLGLHLDEIWRQRKEGTDYIWRTRKSGLFQAGSRLNLPEVIKPAIFEELEKHLKTVGGE